jgi:glycosyltransferase involved in cell wall biosynthesis
MRIGIDIRLFNESGNGRYIRNILREISLLDSSNVYFLFGLSKDESDLKKILIESKNFKYEFIAADFRWYTVKEQIVFPYLLYSKHLDLVHFPHFNVPIFYFKPFVVTVHDLTHFSHSMQQASTLSPLFYAIKHRAYSLVFLSAVKRSQKIITISNYVKEQLIKKFGQYSVSEKTKVIYEASETPLVVDRTSVESALGKYHVDKPFFMYVGNAHPHKNIKFLIEAFQKFNLENKYSLVLVGRDSYFWKQIKNWTVENGLQNNVIFTGFLDDRDLASFYVSSKAYVFPSLSEGFGLPLLEAMSYGCPVLSSGSSSLPEIASDAALFFDPTKLDDLVSVLRKICDDNELRDELIKKGHARVSQFSWKTAGSETLEIYK